MVYLNITMAAVIYNLYSYVCFWMVAPNENYKRMRKAIEFGWVSESPKYIDIKYGNLLVSYAVIVRQIKSGKTVWSLGIPWSSMN